MCLRVFRSLRAAVCVHVFHPPPLLPMSTCASGRLWQCLLALTILRRGWCHFSLRQAGAHAGWPRVSRLIVSGQSLSPLCCFFFFVSFFSCVLPRPRPLQEPRQSNGLGLAVDCTPSCGVENGQVKRDRHSKTKFNWFTACMDQRLAHLFRSMTKGQYNN